MAKKAKKKANVKAGKARHSKHGVGGHAEIPSMTAALSDRVYLQNIGFEIAGIRRALERLSHQIDALERQLSLKKGSSE